MLKIPGYVTANCHYSKLGYNSRLRNCSIVNLEHQNLIFCKFNAFMVSRDKVLQIELIAEIIKNASTICQ